jgi:signal transduction histidine kinase
MLRPVVSKNSIILVTFIVAIATILSLFSYHFFSATSSRIVDISSQEVRSNARIEVHDQSQSLANRLQTVTILLQTLANSPDLQNNEYQRTFLITNYRQDSTSELTDFYMWLNETGKILWISNFNSTFYQKYKGFDLSYRPYFTVPRDTHNAFYSSLIDSNDQVPRLYISYPVISKIGPQYNGNNVSNNDNKTKVTPGTFKGVVVAAIKGVTIGNILENQLLARFNGSVDLLDKKGTVLYTNNQSFIGRRVLESRSHTALASLFPVVTKNSLDSFLNASLQSSTPGMRDFQSEGIINTVAYEPVTIKGDHFLTLFITAPHKLASDVAFLIDQQQTFNMFIVIIIVAVALGAAAMVLTWNKRLRDTVSSRTEELSKSNTLLSESNEQLALANSQLESQDKIQREFINVAAHELRTPIQPILNVTNVLGTKINNKEQKQLLDILIRNANRLQRLSQDILDITMIDSNTLKLNKERISLNDLIYKTGQDFALQALPTTTSNTKIVYEPADKSIADGKGQTDSIIVEVDRERISQVIWNLLSNAIKFTENGTITIATSLNDSEAVVSVADTGEGINPAIRPKLFSKFVTSSFQGTGLGLYISKNIIEAHGGRMWAADDSLKKGATFYFSLPISKRQE